MLSLPSSPVLLFQHYPRLIGAQGLDGLARVLQPVWWRGAHTCRACTLRTSPLLPAPCATCFVACWGCGGGHSLEQFKPCRKGLCMCFLHTLYTGSTTPHRALELSRQGRVPVPACLPNSQVSRLRDQREAQWSISAFAQLTP